ncbi:hypothetical protein DFH29DRAFT_995911 [Suillus ampliporus]|nr:hypothetical protein DFH29DRAFT_995911 [Suillus ampliporus]
MSSLRHHPRTAADEWDLLLWPISTNLTTTPFARLKLKQTYLTTIILQKVSHSFVHQEIWKVAKAMRENQLRNLEPLLEQVLRSADHPVLTFAYSSRVDLWILPKPYLVIKETIWEYAHHGGKLCRREARDLIKIDVNKTSRVWDFLVQAGFLKIRPDPPAAAAQDTVKAVLKGGLDPRGLASARALRPLPDLRRKYKKLKASFGSTGAGVIPAEGMQVKNLLDAALLTLPWYNDLDAIWHANPSMAAKTHSSKPGADHVDALYSLVQPHGGAGPSMHFDTSNPQPSHDAYPLDVQPPHHTYPLHDTHPSSTLPLHYGQ